MDSDNNNSCQNSRRSQSSSCWSNDRRTAGGPALEKRTLQTFSIACSSSIPSYQGRWPCTIAWRRTIRFDDSNDRVYCLLCRKFPHLITKNIKLGSKAASMSMDSNFCVGIPPSTIRLDKLKRHCAESVGHIAAVQAEADLKIPNSVKSIVVIYFSVFEHVTSCTVINIYIMYKYTCTRVHVHMYTYSIFPT